MPLLLITKIASTATQQFIATKIAADLKPNPRSSAIRRFFSFRYISQRAYSSVRCLMVTVLPINLSHKIVQMISISPHTRRSEIYPTPWDRSPPLCGGFRAPWHRGNVGNGQVRDLNTPCSYQLLVDRNDISICISWPILGE